MILSEQQKEFVKMIQKGEITDFEAFIIKCLKPQIRPLGIKYNISGIEFDPDDNVYILDDPRESILIIASFIEVLNYLIGNKVVTLISKYEKIDKNKKLNAFYLFTKPPTEKKILLV